MAVASNALVTLTTVLDELGLTSDGGTQDARLERYINSASAAIASYCNRVFQYEAGIVEKVAGYGSPRLYLSRTPILSISSITLDGSTLNSSDYELDDSAQYLYREDGWIWTASVQSAVRPQKIPFTEDKDFTVTYTGGYITQQQDDDAVGTRTLPYDIEDAALQMVTDRWRSQGRDRSIKAEKLGDASITYGSWELSPEVVSVLKNYKRPVSA